MEPFWFFLKFLLLIFINLESSFATLLGLSSSFASFISVLNFFLFESSCSSSSCLSDLLDLNLEVLWRLFVVDELLKDSGSVSSFKSAYCIQFVCFGLIFLENSLLIWPLLMKIEGETEGVLLSRDSSCLRVSTIGFIRSSGFLISLLVARWRVSVGKFVVGEVEAEPNCLSEALAF